MPVNALLEICIDSIGSAREAAKAGAHRLELCAALPLGGLSPSAGTIRLVKETVDLPVQVLIRPRSGDFCYSDDEFAIMRQDIETAKSLGAAGMVIGILLPDGQIDLERTRELVALARPLEVTFHRAFDVCADPFRALEELIALKIDRLLTSGQQASAPEGAGLIAQLVQQAAGRISILPGAGINETNVEQLLQETGAREVHMSLSGTTASQMNFRRAEVKMGGRLPESEYDHYQADGLRIRQVLELIS
ncbi:MAG: copper homeostasis protein CutC [Adhaeribacter sp.]